MRLVVGKRGTVPMRTELTVRFGHGGWVAWVTRSETGDLLAIADPDMLHLRTPIEIRGAGLTTIAAFAVSAGQQVPFVLTYGGFGVDGGRSAIGRERQQWVDIVAKFCKRNLPEIFFRVRPCPRSID